MNSEVLYRKYRPKSFEEVFGQEHIIKVLENSIKQNKVSHAYLFSGSRGTGKTSVARIFAKNLNVKENDIYEIDAASNRGIDDIRNLRESVRTLPFESPFKVYIIDEVHMLTKEAFNALLKTLEEPPSYVIFILATTEIEKVPETIISRCQTFTFKRPSETILKQAINHIAKEEKYEIDPQALEMIAILGDGSFRDTYGILQKLFSYSKNKKITLKNVEEVTGAPSLTLIYEFLEALWKKDLENGIKALNKAVQQDVSMEIFLKLFLHRLRIVFLLRYAKNFEKLEDHFDKKEIQFLETMAKKESGHINSKTLLNFLEAYNNLKYAFIPQLPIEIALIESLS